MVCFQSYVPQSLVKRDRFWVFFVLVNPKGFCAGKVYGRYIRCI